MGQARRRGTYEERVAQAQAAFNIDKIQELAIYLNDQIGTFLKGKVVPRGVRQNLVKRMIKMIGK